MARLMVCALLLTCVMTTPALAARVYLKGGGVIEATSVWRSKGKVKVLVNRDTLTEFLPQEVNMKRTFPKRAKALKKAVPAPSAPVQAQTEPGTATQQKTAEKKGGLSLPTLPKLPEKDPSALAGKDEGTIRKHKKEMAEKAGE